MIWALILGYLMFGEVPTAMIVLGSAIIAGAGLFVIWREHQLALAHKTAAEVSPAVTAALPSPPRRVGWRCSCGPHPEGAAKRPSKDTGRGASASPFEARRFAP